MVQQNSIPQQYFDFAQNNSIGETAYFRGIGVLNGVLSTIVLELTDNISSNPLITIGFGGDIKFSGEIRSPLSSPIQFFNGEIINNPNEGFVTLRQGFPGIVARLNFSETEIFYNGNIFDDSLPTEIFQYEPTSQSYVNRYLSLPSNFDAAQYGASHPDLIAQIGYNLHGLIEHYLNAGQAEGRALDTFDEAAYLAANPDLFSLINPQSFSQNAGIFIHSQIIPHYIRNGFFENRPLEFDASAYLASNPDVISLVQGNRQEATLHYVLEGHFQGRPRSTFDSKQYLASHSDLLGAFGVNLEVAKDHFVDQGHSEGRLADNFPEFNYIASYPDLIQAFGLNGAAATDHYLYSGHIEQRNPFLFDPFSYMNVNPDLNQAFGGNQLLAAQHYINFGFAEGRSLN